MDVYPSSQTYILYPNRHLPIQPNPTKPTAIKFISRGLSRYRSLISTSPASHSTKVRDSSRPSAPIMPPSHCPYPLRLSSPAFIRKWLSCLRVCVNSQSYRQSPHLQICTSPHLHIFHISASPPLYLFTSPPLHLSTSPSLHLSISLSLHLFVSLSLHLFRFPSSHISISLDLHSLFLQSYSHLHISNDPSLQANQP